MKIVVLGFGGWVSNPVYGQTSVLVSSDSSEEYILLDSGEGVLRSMFECGFSDVEKLRAVVVTHRHGDHLLGLPTIVQFAKIVGSRVIVVGLKETVDSLIEMLRAVSVSNYECCLEFMVVDPGSTVEIAGLKLRFAEAKHTIPGLAVRVEGTNSGKCLVYTGDTSYSEQIVKLARGCDILLHEASFSESDSSLAESLGHSTTLDCLRTAAEAGSKFVLPLHFGLAKLKLDIDSIPQSVTVIYPSKCLTIHV
ncbi:MAG: ribonuclease Z [Sulfolobales archaeon]|nr:ribonuclease Z [Sulfolobales archaeon]MCX8208959.1 ribonuclease Z [Sulfolobales archaeon]MDW8011004.1 ribonuclease Z [Sulfolobales archaeon]